MFRELPELSILRRNWLDYEDPATTHQVSVGSVTVGGSRPVVIAGPCAVESFEQTLGIAEAVSRAGGDLLRGGAFKPRSNPHSFQGLGNEALEILKEVRARTGLGVVTEVMDPRLVDHMSTCVDVLQIGSRSMQNFPLLKEVGRTNRPVLLKRGWSATLEEWLCAAEYIALEGNRDIMLCERGVRASCHDGYARHILDLNVVEAVRHAVPFPVIVDPSHAAGEASRVAALACAALAAGAHGLLIEVVLSEEQRADLKCDASQGVLPDSLADITVFARGTGKTAKAEV